ncbi:conserved hypothetical protein [Leishmania mexicana MHOM/GT/2001/U1103]|uniref:Uncharacterized protein n=1 Tax=Leishmania mexicana (strain MHOM/GT/2001/U1103) TaxID=929439 RepID=E9AWS0_LEIMU|nr:conserved hypothetical protein [Leishmania mexicana MHOM/GT/2001/U1103]CBZ27406.1 conserved hypothetical protein [Leishmania mexicana MHOM/GT/2001/U1103]
MPDMSSSDDAPPHKRLASEQSKRDSGTHVGAREHIHDAPALSARTRFLRELERYASDDDDYGGNAGAVAVGAGSMRQTNHANGAPQRRSEFPMASATRAAAPSVGPSSSSDFFFGGEDDPHGKEGDDAVGDDAMWSTAFASPLARSFNGAPVTDSTSDSGIKGSGAAPSRVGLQLLHHMHALNTSGDRRSSGHNPVVHSAAAKAKTKPHTSLTPTSSGDFEVVHAYVPLSTGGFLSTANAAHDTMEGHQVRIGDVLSLRKPLSCAGPPSSSAVASTPVSSPTTSTATPSTAASALTTGSVVEDVAQKAMCHFKSAATFTSEEQKYGRKLSPDMVRLLFEVTRVDYQGRTIEALFLDGTRAKVFFFEARPAGYVERKLYATWKADPASRPVAVIHSNASSPTTSLAPNGAGLPSSAPSPALPPPPPSVTAVAWWVIPRLLVRVTTEAAGDWYGKKCVVKTVQRSENRVRLMEWVEEGRSGGGESGSRSVHNCGGLTAATTETRELVGVDGLETVVPKKGGRAMVVLGSRRGEMCTVRSRVRGADGELTAVEVELNRTKEVVTLQAGELCALAR